MKTESDPVIDPDIEDVWKAIESELKESEAYFSQLSHHERMAEYKSIVAEAFKLFYQGKL